MRWRIVFPAFILTTFALAASHLPLTTVLQSFTAANVPSLGPNEHPIDRSWPDPISVVQRPGHGISQHPMLYAGEGYNDIFLVNGGKVIWNYFTGPRGEIDDVWLLTNGHILFTRQFAVEEVTPQKRSSGTTTRRPVLRSTVASPSGSTKFC
jgi:hypothetical protein